MDRLSTAFGIDSRVWAEGQSFKVLEENMKRKKEIEGKGADGSSAPLAAVVGSGGAGARTGDKPKAKRPELKEPWLQAVPQVPAGNSHCACAVRVLVLLCCCCCWDCFSVQLHGVFLFQPMKAKMIRTSTTTNAHADTARERRNRVALTTTQNCASHEGVLSRVILFAVVCFCFIEWAVQRH